MPQPHVLLLICDQMRADRLGVIDPQAHTPHLDELCRRGVHCRNAFSNHPQCAPARACLFTGQYSHQAGVLALKGFAGQHSTLSPQHPSFAKVFAQHNYRTVYFGKGHFEIPLADMGFNEGHCTDGIQISDEEASRRGYGFVSPSLRRDYQAHSEACDWLQDFSADQRPLLFCFSTNLPHPPFFKHPDYSEHFCATDLQLPASYGKEDFSGKPDFIRQHHAAGHAACNPAQQRQELADYYSMIASMDQHFGDIINSFKQRGLWDNTVVLLLADHGEMMGAHNLRLKGCLPYDDLLRVPMIWRFPGDAHAGQTCDALLDQVHIAGSLLQAAGIEIPSVLSHGSQLTQVCAAEKMRTENTAENGDDLITAEAIFFEHYAAGWGVHPFRGIRTQHWKYVFYYGADENGFEELYQLSNDPLELDNLALQASAQMTKAHLRQRCETWWQESDGKELAFYQSEEFCSGRWNQQRY